MDAITSSSGAVVVDNRSFGERFIANAEAKLRSASTYVGPIVGVLAGIGLELWKSMNADQQGALIGGIGIPHAWTAIVIAIVAHLASVFKPPAAGAVSAQTQALLEQIAHLKLNEQLRALGQAEMPSPASADALTATPNVRIVVAPSAESPLQPNTPVRVTAETPPPQPTPVPAGAPSEAAQTTVVLTPTTSTAPAVPAVPGADSGAAKAVADDVVVSAKKLQPNMTAAQEMALRAMVQGLAT